jgi:hypothetical protein
MCVCVCVCVCVRVCVCVCVCACACAHPSGRLLTLPELKKFSEIDKLEETVAQLVHDSRAFFEVLYMTTHTCMRTHVRTYVTYTYTYV